MSRRRLVLVFSVTMLGWCLASCSSDSGSDGGRASGGSAYVRRLHAEAVEKGYDGQAKLLADGKVSYAELRAANQANIRCADRQGVALKTIEFTDMQGRREGLEPVNTSGPVDVDFVNGVIETCQRTEQMLVDQAYANGLPEISDSAHGLWVQCAHDAGYTDRVPKSYRQINIDLPPDLLASCEQWVQGELEKARN